MPTSNPSLSPNLAFRHALTCLHANISKSFKDAGRNEILKISLDTTLEYVIDDGGAIVWPSDTNVYFLLNFTSIFMSNIMCTMKLSYPGLIFTFPHFVGCNAVKFLKQYTDV